MTDLKILESHPVQYHAPLFKEISHKGINIEVAYTHQGAAGQEVRDTGFGIDFAWDLDLLSGYPYRIFNRELDKYQKFRQINFTYKHLTWSLLDKRTPLLLMGWFAEFVWLIWLLRIFSHAPTIVFSETTPLSFAATPKPRWRVLLLRWLLQHTTANLFIGRCNRVFLREMGVNEERLFHVPYSIDNLRFEVEVDRLMPERYKLCQQYGLNPEIPVFLFCGKLIQKKRPLELLEAYLAADLADQAQLLYVGEGELRPQLEQRIQALDLKHVHMLGFLNQTQMPLAYVLGELLCLISGPTETWGLVVNEALACGRPVIISDKVGCGPDLVSPENGWVTPLDDQCKLVETLIIAFEKRADWKHMGEFGRKRVAQNTFSSMAGGVIAALRFAHAFQIKGN
jgi:glycosyltransferase involved in cell wall biosynthesis